MSRTPGDHLTKARTTLADARRIASLVPRVAAREGYLAAFHAAQALILARTGKASRTHHGVNTTFALLARDETTLGPGAAAFLAGSYDIKQHSDYQVGSEEVSYDVTDAEATLTRAGELIEAITALVKL